MQTTNAERTTELGDKNARPQRIYGLDNLKVLICLIVVISHVMIPYINIGIPWYFEPTLPNETLEMNPLINFLRICGMSIFFMVSGYFIPTSYDKQGFGTFLWKKAKRLLIPAFAFWGLSILCTPYPMYHVWFLQMLFGFCLLYALFRKLTNWRIKEGSKLELSMLILVAYFTLICATSLLIRQKFYLSHFTVYFNLFLVEESKLPQYILSFIFGLLARRFDWINCVSKKVVIQTAIVIAISYVIKEWRITEQNYIGSRLFTILESSLCLFASLMILWIFNKYANITNRFIATLSENSLGIYLIHMPILYYVQTYTKTWEMNFPLKLALIMLFVISTAFLLSFLLRKSKFIRQFI